MNKKIVGKVLSEMLGLFITLLVLYYLLPFLTFITDKYYFWLPIAVVCNFISSFFDIVKFFVKGIYYFLFKGLSLFADVISSYYLIIIFPFDFDRVGLGWINIYLPYFLYFSILVMVISLFRLVYKSYQYKGQDEKILR